MNRHFQETHTHSKKAILALLMAGAFLLSACTQEGSSSSQNLPSASAGEADLVQNIEATTMRLLSFEGDVSIHNIGGSEITPTEDMKLQNGYTVKTAAASYAYISLDDEKAVKLDGLTEFSVRQRGDRLEILLLAGQLYFDVGAPLADSEVMNIRTSNMVTGIRGTSGFVSASWQGRIEQQASALLSGTVQVDVHEITNEITSHTLESGFIEYYRPFDETMENAVQTLPLLDEGTVRIPAFVLSEVLENPQALEALAESAGLSETELTERLQAALLTQVEQEEAEQMARQEAAQQAEQGAQVQQQTTTDTRNQMFTGDSATSGGATGSLAASSSSSSSAASSPSPPSSSSASSSSSSSPSSSSTSSSTPSSSLPSTPTTDPSVSTLTGTVTLEQIRAEFAKRTPVTTVILSDATVTGSGGLDVPSGVTLKTQGQVTFSGEVELLGSGNFLVESGSLQTGANELAMEALSANVAAGATLNTGTLKVKGMNFTNEGAIHAADLILEENGNFENSANISLAAVSDALKVAENATMTNSGTLSMANVPFADRAVENKGIFSNAAAASLSTPGEVLITGSTASFTNSGNMAVGAANVDDTAARFTNGGTLSFSPANDDSPALSIKGIFESTAQISGTAPVKVLILDAQAQINAGTLAQITQSSNVVLVDDTGSYTGMTPLDYIQLEGKPILASDLQEVVAYVGAQTANNPQIDMLLDHTFSAGLAVNGEVTINAANLDLNLGANTITVQSGGHLTLTDFTMEGSSTLLRIEDGATVSVAGNYQIEKSGGVGTGFVIQMNTTSGGGTLNYTRDGESKYIKAVGAADGNTRLMGDLAGNANVTAQGAAVAYTGGQYWMLETHSW